MGLLNLLLAKNKDKVQTAKEEQSQPLIPPFIVPATATQTFLAAMLVYTFHPVIPIRHLLFFIIYPTCPTYLNLILANHFHPILSKKHSDPNTSLKKDKSVCWSDAKDDSTGWAEPVKETSIRWNGLTGGGSMGSLFSEDSVSRGLGGFRRGSVESWGDLEDDVAIPVIMNVSVIGSGTAARARAA